MLAALVFTIATTATPQDEAKPAAPRPEAAKQSLLDELIERSRGVKSCSARLTMTRPDQVVPTLIRVDYRAPDALRLRMEGDGSSSSIWCVGSVMVLRNDDGGKQTSAMVDLDDLHTKWRQAEERLRRTYPPAPAPGSPAPSAGSGRSALLALRWSFDEAAQEGKIDLCLLTAEDVETPFGWLTTLRDKQAAPTVDGGHLRFTTDAGHFDLSLSKATGFLETLAGRGPEGTTTLELGSVIFDAPIEADSVALPTDPPAGEDASLELRGQIDASIGENLRARIYAAVAEAKLRTPWDDAELAKIDSVVRPVQELILDAWLAAWLESMQRWIGESVDHLRQVRLAGATADQVRQVRSDSRSSLIQQLDDGEAAILAMPLPEGIAPSARDADLLAFERDVALQILRRHYRAPLLIRFDRESSEK